jgi:hypothetical protein
MTMKKTLRATLGTALLTAACTSTPAAPTPVAPTIQESFTGTLAPLRSSEHTFNVQQVGGIKVTLSSVDPNATVRLGIGTGAAPTCLILKSVDVPPGTTPQLSGTATKAGNFCVSISDPGTLVDTVTYTINLLHS